MLYTLFLFTRLTLTTKNRTSLGQGAVERVSSVRQRTLTTQSKKKIEATKQNNGINDLSWEPIQTPPPHKDVNAKKINRLRINKLLQNSMKYVALPRRCYCTTAMILYAKPAVTIGTCSIWFNYPPESASALFILRGMCTAIVQNL